MKRTGAYGIILAFLALASCKEIGPDIDFGHLIATDTTYLGATPAKDARVVLIEEFTGVRCPNCPDGHAKLEAIKTTLGNGVVVLSVQPGGFLPSLTLPIETITQHDNTTADGKALCNFLDNTTQLPVASIDRVQTSGKIFLAAINDWPGAANGRVSVATPVNLTLTSSYNSAKREAVIKVKLVYTEELTAFQYLTVSIKEDSIIDAQEDHAVYDTFYVHNNLLRDIITSPQGTRILDTLTKFEKGRVYERTFVYTLDAAWKPEHCKIVACVSKSDSGNKEVEQAAETKLAP